MPWIVSDEIMISCSHQILEENGQREPLHGHNWRVRIFIAADKLDARGLTADFAVLRKVLWEVVEPWDHHHLNELEDFQSVEPSTEEMARLAFERCAARLDDGRIRVERVEVWMTDTGCATYQRSL